MESGFTGNTYLMFASMVATMNMCTLALALTSGSKIKPHKIKGFPKLPARRTLSGNGGSSRRPFRPVSTPLKGSMNPPARRTLSSGVGSIHRPVSPVSTPPQPVRQNVVPHTLHYNAQYDAGDLYRIVCLNNAAAPITITDAGVTDDPQMVKWISDTFKNSVRVKTMYMKASKKYDVDQYPDTNIKLYKPPSVYHWEDVAEIREFFGNRMDDFGTTPLYTSKLNEVNSGIDSTKIDSDKRSELMLGLNDYTSYMFDDGCIIEDLYLIKMSVIHNEPCYTLIGNAQKELKYEIIERKTLVLC